MKLGKLELSAEDKINLKELVKKGQDWRARERAQTILYFDKGWSAKAIAEQQGHHLDTVYDRRKSWLEKGYASLSDRYRCGAPSKLNTEQKELLRQWASEEALSSRVLLTKLKEACDVVIHPNTLGKTLRQMGFVWKRTRHSLKKTG
jgi:transposase